jgi:polar amino acid transport system substrate-binding protein
MKPGLLLILLCAALLPARAERIIFAVSTGSAMPMTQFQHETLTAGLLKDMGDALARELRVNAVYLVLPRKRVEAALLSGQADLLCDLRPEWLDSKHWVWTEPVFSNNMTIVSRADTAPLARLSQLRGQRVGTVLGYRYPELEKRLGAAFERDDGITDEQNTSKLLSGRFNYMMSNSLYDDYQRKVHPQAALLNRAVFTVRPFDTYCALPPKGRLDPEQVNRAILTLRRRGDMQAIYARYRPHR